MSVPASRIAAQRLGAPRAATRAGDARLEVVRARTRANRRHRVAPLVSAALVSSSLLAVVVGHAVLAQEQVRLAAVQAEVTSAQVVHRRDIVSVANLGDPSRVLREAETTLHMVTPGQVIQVPHVTLGTPVQAPKVSPDTTSATAPATKSGT